MKITFCCIILFLISIYSNSQNLTKENGVIDLSSITFTSKEQIFLNAKYYFYWDTLLNPLLKELKKPDLFINVPDQWNNYSLKDKKLPIYGVATYCLKLVLKDTINHYKLNIPYPIFPAKYYINGTPVAESGIVHYNRNKISHKYSFSSSKFKSHSDTLTLVIHVANFKYEKGGLSFPIQIGRAENIDKQLRSSSIINNIFIGCILLMAIYHFILFALRRKDQSPLYLALSCLGIGIIYFMLDYEFINILFPEIHYDQVLYFSPLPYSLLYFGYFMMVYYLFPKEFPKKILYIVLVISLFNYFFLLIAPSVATKLEQIFRILRAITMLYSFVVVILAVIRKRDDAVLFLIGYGFLISSVVIDMLVQINALTITSPLKLGILLFFFNQAFIVARRFSCAFKKSENLAAELAMLNQSLEQKVIERTSTIEEQKNDLEKLNGMKDKLFSIIGHDLRSPLASLSGVSNVVKMLLEKKRFDTLERVSEQIETSVNNVNSLLDNLLKWAFIQTKQTMFNPAKCDIAHIIESTIDIYKPAAELKDIEIVYAKNNNTEIFLDENLLRTVLRNLISNAIKFSHPNSIIQVHQNMNGTMLQISIKDSGIGMNEDTKKELFILSDKKVKNGTNNEKGTGLGLLLCKEFIKMHNGEIKVESVLNKGTTFICTIPINGN